MTEIAAQIVANAGEDETVLEVEAAVAGIAAGKLCVRNLPDRIRLNDGCMVAQKS